MSFASHTAHLTDALLNAAKCGDLGELERLFALAGPMWHVWINYPADYAAQRGHLDALKWIVDHGGTMTSAARTLAAVNGHQHVVQWMSSAMVESGSV